MCGKPGFPFGFFPFLLSSLLPVVVMSGRDYTSSGGSLSTVPF